MRFVPPLHIFVTIMFILHGDYHWTAGIAEGRTEKNCLRKTLKERKDILGTKTDKA